MIGTGFGFWVQGLGLGVWGTGFRVSGLRVLFVKVSGLGRFFL